MYNHKVTSLADQIFERLEHDILIGEYAIGEVLTETKLSEKLGVSRTPIREALLRLQQERLVEDTSKGTLVLGISREDINDIYEIRLPMELLAVERFIKNADEETVKKLGEIVELQEFYCGKGDSEKVMLRDSEFHEFLYSNCGSHIIGETLIPLHRKVVKFRKNSIKRTGRAAQSVNEHRNIFELIKARDIAAAGAAMQEHITNAKQSISKGEDK